VEIVIRPVAIKAYLQFYSHLSVIRPVTIFFATHTTSDNFFAAHTTSDNFFLQLIRPLTIFFATHTTTDNLCVCVSVLVDLAFLFVIVALLYGVLADSVIVVFP
jgi:hypothetical protein